MSVETLVGGIVGGVAGFFLGGPGGAAIGFGVGAGIFGALSVPKGPSVPGPRLSDLSVQTSTYGAFIPRVYGTIGIHGNLLWLENNQLKETVRKKKQGGKGSSGGTTVKTYSYSATFILALCQGPIAGVRRIWCMDKLIYNAGSDDLETIIASNQAAKGWKIYLGTDDQLPDTRYEADVGADNASAFRGIAYLAFYDFQLADYSNTLQAAQFKVEVLVKAKSPVNYAFSSNSIVQHPDQVYQFGLPGGSSDPAYYSTFLNGPTRLLQVANSGSVRETFLPDYGTNPEKYIHVPAVSLDRTKAWFRPVIDPGRDTLTYFDGNTYRTIYVGYDLVNLRIIESGGHIWLSWSSVSGGDDPAPSGQRWIAKWEEGHDFILQPRAAYPLNRMLCGKPDGSLIVSFYTDLAENQSGTCFIVGHDQNMDVYLSESFTIPARTGQLSSESSCSCVDVEGYIHYVMLLFRSPVPFPAIYGHFYYMRVNILDGSIDKSGVIIDPVNNFNHLVPGQCRASDGVLYFSGGEQDSRIWRSAWLYSQIDQEETTLAEVIVSELSSSVLLGATDIDVSAINNSVNGYRVTGGSIRSALEPLQSAYPFDVVQSGYQIKCVPRGQAVAANILWEDLGAAAGAEPGEVLRESREMDTQLPASTTVNVLDADREYSVLPQTASRIGTEAVNRVDRELPIVLSADEAAGVAEVLQGLAWLERLDFSFSLPPTYLSLEPADVVTVQAPQAVYQLRITEAKYGANGRIACKAKPNQASLYVPNATGGTGVEPVGTVPLLGASVFVPLDIPIVDEVFQDEVGFVGAMAGSTSGWPGALLVRSNDGGQTWSDLQGFTGKATIGTARGTLPASSATLIDQRSLVVDLISGELESVTRDQMLAGVNYAAYGVDGRWEIVRFQNATLQGDGSYLVSGFVRGERGTEWATGLHQAGDYFVLLDDPDNIFIGAPVESIGLERIYRGVTSGASIDTAEDVSFAYRGVNLECLSPVYARGSRDGSGNFSGAFTRRSRLSSSWWTTGVEAPLGEAAQAYEIDVMDGATVARTITATTPAFTYTAAEQTTDFGSAQPSITFRIYQLSEVVGRGYPLEVTL